MRISITLPNTLPSASGKLLVAWAVRAEELGFSGIAVTERLVYPGHDPLLVLAAAAAATSRIRLSSNIVIGPLRSTAVLAKQAATLASLSEGRFTLGVGPGVRSDDFDAAERDFAGRSRAFDLQLEELHRIRSAPDSAADNRNLPSPTFPVMVGGMSANAVRRVVTWADGWTAPGLEPDLVLPAADRVRKGWTEAGRPGKPHLVALLRFSLGEDVASESSEFMRDYFAVLGEEAEAFVAQTPRTADRIRQKLAALEAGGIDEVVFHPTAARLSQVDRLAEIVFGTGASTAREADRAA